MLASSCLEQRQSIGRSETGVQGDRSSFWREAGIGEGPAEVVPRPLVPRRIGESTLVYSLRRGERTE